jgi:hypothetical protein
MEAGMCDRCQELLKIIYEKDSQITEQYEHIRALEEEIKIMKQVQAHNSARFNG